MEKNIATIGKQMEKLQPLGLEDIPSLDLYMDQVLTILDTALKDFKRAETDEVMTKTMINNYVKHGLLPPPEKKKYGKKQIIYLALISHLKNILSLKDIGMLFSILDSSGTNMEVLYEAFLKAEKQNRFWQENIGRYLDTDFKKEENMQEEKEASVQNEDKISADQQLFISLLSLVYDSMKTKLLVEKMLDMYADQPEKNKLQP